MGNKLILICSDISEATTDDVCRWLNYYNKKFIRISNENLIVIKTVIIKNNEVDIVFEIDDKEYKLSDFDSYWYRRSKLNFEKLNPVEYIYQEINLSDKMNLFLLNEYDKITDFFKFKLNQIAVLNKYEDNNLNKLTVLTVAKEMGIKVPDTYIVDDFKLLNFNKESYITKAVSDFIIVSENKSYYSMTQRIDENDGEMMKKSLIQKEVKKKFEIRSFFFNRTFYSSAIFSQENDKTELDFRNYDFENPNNIVPFKIPNYIENKLLKLSDKLGLKSGSFDIAYTFDDEYVLFEVNPVGQFEQVSGPCNYNLHKLIAQSL